jgi:hypothetical protein
MASAINATRQSGSLRKLRRRMIRELESFLAGTVGRADLHRVIPTACGPMPPTQSGPGGVSRYDSGAHQACGESGPC